MLTCSIFNEIFKHVNHLNDELSTDLAAPPNNRMPVLPAGNVLQKNSTTALNYHR